MSKKLSVKKEDVPDFLDKVKILAELLEEKEKEEARKLREAEEAEQLKWELDEHQVPPEDDDWSTWVLLAGRGVGKTFALAYYINNYARRNSDARIGIVAVNQQEAVDVCVNGESGLKKFNKDIKVRVEVGGTHIRWPNGAQARVFGASTVEEVDKIRGQNFSIIWADEIAAWKQLEYAWQMMTMALRINIGNIDEWPRIVASTTPRKNKFLKQLLERKNTRRSKAASTLNAKHLNERVKQDLLEQYGGTRIGRQELEGELLEDVEGAIWKSDWIDSNRISIKNDKELKALIDSMKRIVVSVDPAVTSKAPTDKNRIRGSDETAVCVAGIGEDGDYYVFHAEGLIESPNDWGNRVVKTYKNWKADKVIVETNQGGDLVVQNIKMISKDIPIKQIHAYRGKVLRAEPIANLYEQGRVHHVGMITRAEDQMVVFPVDQTSHDDLVDAVVYAITELQGKSGYGVRFLYG